MFADVDDVSILLDDVDGHDSGTYQIRLNTDFIESLKSSGIERNNLFCCVFAYTLSRFIGTDNVLFNMVLNENHSKSPLLISCKNQDAFSFIEYCSDLIGKASKYGCRFEEIESEYGVYSNVLFQYGDDVGDSSSDLNVCVSENENGCILKIDYSDKYSKHTVRRFAQSYDLILSQILKVNELSDINYTTSSDLELLDTNNQTEHPLSYDDILDAFNDNLNRYPHNKLVSYNDNAYSYAESAFIASEIASRLTDLGVKSQDKVAFLVKRSELYLFNVLAILSIGAVYVPLDTNLPDERIEFILEDTDSKVLIVSDETFKNARKLSKDGIILNVSDIVNKKIGTLSYLSAVSGHLACILYTSGTTGVPKGVKITRKSILNVAEWYVEGYGLCKDDVFGMFSSIGFDVASSNITVAMYAGACLDVIPSDVKLDMHALNNHFIKQGVNHADLPTQVAKLFISQIDNVPLDVLYTGGEKLGEFDEKVSCRLVDAYGPTEAYAEISTVDVCDRIDSSSIGYLVNNIKAYVLDKEKRRVPIGAVGELCLAGYQIADGYLNRDEETHKAFLDNPFYDDECYNVMYCTGDLVRVLPDGTLGIVGRRDSQVKIRGNRVELSEIESLIRELDYVEDVTVQTIKNGDNNELVAYVVTDNDLDDIELNIFIKDYVAERKPEYMIPSFVIGLDEIPLNINGKVDKKALPEVDLCSLSAEYAAPTNENEELVVEAFEKVFNKEKIGINDDFIRLGGDSLTAIKLLNYLKGYNISSAEILSLKTPKAIAENIKKDNLDLNLFTLESGCPLNESQLNVYLDIIAHNKVDSYLAPFSISIPKKYDANKICAVLDEMLKAHPILKMRVSEEHDVPYLIMADNPPVIIKNDGNTDYIYDFIKEPFDLYKNLSRYLIFENDDGYTLFIVLHHLICDDLTLKAFEDSFKRLLNGEKVNVDASFLKVAAFDQLIKEKEKYAEAREFYDLMLVESDEVNVLMDDVVDSRPGIVSCEFKSDLHEFISKNNISENVLFTCVFAYTLSRFVGGDKVLFNLIENGRSRFNNFDAIGMFANTLPILVNCKNRSVSSFMEYISNLVYDVMKYNYYPFRILAKEYDVDSSVLFQYVPNWINAEDHYVEEFRKDIIGDMRDVIGDLVVFVLEEEDNYRINIEYSDKFSPEFIKRFIESYIMILEDMIDSDKLGDINYITSDDLMLLDSYNETSHDLKYGSILEAFNDHLSKRPDKILTISDDVCYTYAESAYLINELNELLNENNVSPKDRVGIFVSRNHWVFLSALSCVSKGITYVQIDEKYPDQRIAFMIEQSSVKFIITNDLFEPRINNIIGKSNLDLSIINVDRLTDDVRTSEYVDYVDETVNDVACIIYTSGTTGLPKAVQMTRMQLVNFMQFYADSSNFTCDSVQGIFVSIGFDISLEQYVSIFAGGSLLFVPNEVRLDLNRLNEYYMKHNVTHTFITTQIAKLFIDTISETSLKYLRTGGEKLGNVNPPEGYILTDLYGPAEYNAISAMDIDKREYESSVGQLNWNTKTYILDAEQRRVPLGAVGEIYVSGYQITPGYLDNPKANEKVLFANPFDGDTPGYEKMYKTGDIARYLPNGTIGIVGRSDTQVKIRGNRVELSEIEVTLRNLDFVEDVTVQTTLRDGNHELVAYVVASQGFDGDLTEYIQSQIREKKPDYMIPSYVIALDKIPLTVNGKVDKRALPEVDMGSLRAEYVAPSNEREKIVVDAFEKVFGQDKISILDDFAVLGGDSLTAVKLLSLIGDYNISAADILSLRTPIEIAKKIKEENYFDSDIYSLDSGCPLTESQLNVYLDIVSHDKTDSYLIPLSMDISKEYDITKLHNALEKMFEVHPILEMRISDDFEVPYLVKGKKPLICIKDAVEDDFIIEFLSKPFDLNESLCRFLITENDDNYSIYAVFHHIIFDAISDLVFKGDFVSILKDHSINPDTSFLKVSAFDQQIKETDEYGDAELFYDKMLSEIDEVNVLLDVVNADGPGYYSDKLDIDLKDFLSKNNISENVLFTSVFAYTLSRFAGSDKILFNIVENGRSRFNNFDSIGMFVNTLPILIDCKNQNAGSFIGNVFDRLYDVMKYSYYPFRLLANKYDLNSDILFQYLPMWVKVQKDGDSIEELVEETIEDAYGLIGDFIVYIVETKDDYEIKCIYSDKFSSDFVERFIDSYKLILHQIIGVNELNEIIYTSNSDLMLLDSYNETEHALAYDDVLDAFNDNLSRNPDSKMVSFNDRSYSYAEGAYIADRIVKKLMELGVNPQDCVSFLVERSELYVFCILGIMAMGGVYVPLDVAHPDERLKFILEDTQSNVVIVSDETCKRAEELSDNCTLINISRIHDEDIGSSSCLPARYCDLACILYTSGSTGFPKGVKITRKSILNISQYYEETYGLCSDDVYGLYASIGFDVATFGIFAAVYVGARLSVVPWDIRLNMNELNRFYMEQGITHTVMTTQVAKLFIDHIDETSLKVLLTGGEKLGEFEGPDDYTLVDVYGPTESFMFTHTVITSQKIDFSSVGFLNYNVKSYILDDEGRRVPFGAVGELYLAGYQVAEGYLNRDEEDAKAFLDNPFDDSEGFCRLYRTGDVVRFLPDGSLGIVGRRDSQVKIRGNRVELSEIEKTIREIEGIDDVTVQAVKNGTNFELVAYVVASDEIDDIKDYVCDYVSEHKPGYMVPSFVVELDEIPLNVNGKVDKRALPDVDLDALQTEYVPPTNETEKEIVEAFEKVFNKEKIGIHDDFIQLGGDSLTAIKLISLLNINISPAALFNHRTPHNIAQNISEDKNEYSFELVKKGEKNQNMFLLPPIEGLSSAFLNLVNNTDFDGNIYIIDDFKYGLSLDEIKTIEDNGVTLDHYYSAIRDIFQNGDILVGYSLGCIYASLLCEKLEKSKQVENCILIDGPLQYVNDEKISTEELISEYGEEEYNHILNNHSDEFRDKFIEILKLNSNWNFHTPKIKSHITYIGTSDTFMKDLDKISDDHEFILIDSNHKDIIQKDIGKIAEYIK